MSAPTNPYTGTNGHPLGVPAGQPSLPEVAAQQVNEIPLPTGRVPIPQDHQTKADQLGDYHYTTANGTEIVLPPFKSIKPGIIRKTRKLPPVDQFFTTLEMIVPESVMEIVDELDAEEFNDFQRGWYEHSGIDLGE